MVPVARVLLDPAVVVAAAPAGAGPVRVGLVVVAATLLAAAVVVGRQHLDAAAWRGSWQLVGLGAAGTAGAAALAHHLLPVADAIVLAAMVTMAIGLGTVLRDRTTQGRAVDSALEVALAVAALGFVLVAWATGRPGQLQALELVVLLQPVAALGVLWLLLRVIAVTPDGGRPLHMAVAASLAVFGAQAWRAGDVLDSASPMPTTWAAVLLGVGLAVWAVTLLHPGLHHPGPPSPVAGRDLSTTNVLTLMLPLVLGPATSVAELVDGDARPWVVLVGAFLLPMLMAWLLVRQVQLRARREFLAQHDPLTGLPNQRLFLDEVEVHLGRIRRVGGGFAIMFLDLDRFKTVNDSLGHSVGDDLLRAVANRLVATGRGGDIVARVGGDEFTMLLPGVVDEEVARERAQELRTAFASPLHVGDRELFTGASVGVVLAPRDGDRADLLLTHADTAMYRAKATGSSGTQVYSGEMNTRARLRLSLEQQLRRAEEGRELSLWYQPKVRVEDRRVVGHEALLRWNHPSLGLITPGGIVQLAEETGLVASLGRWVIQEACQQVAAWNQHSRWPRPLAVNISPAHLSETPLDELVQTALRASGIHPRLLEIEITETALLHDLEATARAVERVRRLGVTVTLDDFGTGYAGLGYLTRIPLDRVKLDRSFVASIRPGAVVSPIVEAVLSVASNLGLEVIAEGVETEHQARWLGDHGCDTFQGYLFGHPAPAQPQRVATPRTMTRERLDATILAVCQHQPAPDEHALGDLLHALEAPRSPDVETRMVAGMAQAEPWDQPVGMLGALPT